MSSSFVNELAVSLVPMVRHRTRLGADGWGVTKHGSRRPSLAQQIVGQSKMNVDSKAFQRFHTGWNGV